MRWPLKLRVWSVVPWGRSRFENGNWSEALEVVMEA